MVLTTIGEDINKKYATVLIRHVIAKKMNIDERSDDFKIIWHKYKKDLLNVKINKNIPKKYQDNYDTEYVGTLINYISFNSGYFYSNYWTYHN